MVVRRSVLEQKGLDRGLEEPKSAPMLISGSAHGVAMVESPPIASEDDALNSDAVDVSAMVKLVS